MDGLSVAANVAGVVSLGVQVTKALLKYYNDYKGREAEVASTIKKLDRLLGMLESLTSHLSKYTQPLSKDGELLTNIQSAIKDCEEYIEELQRQCEKFKDAPSTGLKAKARTAARKLIYPLRKSTLDTIDETVDEIVSHISFALQLIQQKSIDQVQTEAEEIKALLQLVQASQFATEIRGLLAAPDVSSNYYAACRTRHNGTGKWLVEGDAFSTWLARANSFLWLYGFAGCGKSVLCSTAIQHVFRHRNSNPQIGIAFFFFTFNDTSKQDISAMLRAVVSQLAGQVKEGKDVLATLKKYHGDGKAPDEILIECLKKLIQSTDGTYILIDALDESPRDRHRWRLLEVLIDIRNWSEDRLHLLVTSRDEPDIREAVAIYMNASVEDMISLRNDFVSNDIEEFITGTLETDRRLRKWVDFHDHIKETLTKRAKGVFRWVECQFTALASTPKSKRQLDAVLAALPRSLDETYDRVLGNIGEESRSDARRLLTLLCCSLRPLTVAEVIEGIAVELGDNPRINPNGRLNGEDDILMLCPGLIEIDRLGEVLPAFRSECPRLSDIEASAQFLGAEDDFDAYPDSFQSIVRIAHFSVQEYLESERICKKSASSFSVQLPDAHAEVASVCLTYLLELPSRKWHPEYALAIYAASNWEKHYENADTAQHGAQDQALRLFGPDTSKLNTWARLRGIPTGSPIYQASCIGLHSLLREILRHEPYCTVSPEQLAQTIDGELLLLAAVEYDHLSVVEVLVEKGANIDICTKTESPLTASIFCMSDEITQFLIDQGADLNICPEEGESALQIAIGHCNVPITDLLLQKGAKAFQHRIELTAGDVISEIIHRSVFSSQTGSAAVVRTLLKRCNSLGMEEWYDNGMDLVSFIQRAKNTFNLDIVSLLLDHIANIDINENFVNADIWNRYGLFDVPMIRLMLEKGFRLPLFSAILKCSVDLRHNTDQAYAQWLGQYFLDNCANSHMPSFTFEHVGATVASYGLMEMADEVLRCSTNLDDSAIQDCYSISLQYAALNGWYEAVERLLAAGADANFEGGRYSSALYTAVLGGNDAIVRLLIEHGANIDALRDERGVVMDDMCESYERTYSQMSKLLLWEYGFEDNFGTPLYAAASLGHDSIAQLLIENGADVNLRRVATGFCHKFATAFLKQMRSAQAENGQNVHHDDGNFLDRIDHRSILELFSKYESRKFSKFRGLRNSVKFNCCHSKERTPVFVTPWGAAAQKGDKSTECLLLAAGADISYDVKHLCLGEVKGATVSFLIESGADVNLYCEYHKQPLHAAIKSNDEIAVRLLIDNGADVNYHCKTFGTPLHAAIESNDEIAVRLLIDNGADVNYHCETYGTPLHSAAGNIYISEEVTRLLIEKHADVNLQCECHGPIISCATKNASTEVLRLLIENGADVNVVSMDQKTPLQQAIDEYDSYDTVKLLLENGADVNVVSMDQKTPLQQAIEKYDSYDTVKLLLENGACLTFFDSHDGHSVMRMLRFKRDFAIYRLLQKYGGQEMM